MALAPAEFGARPASKDHIDLTSPLGKKSSLLREHPVYRGEGVPRGDSHPVMPAPGLWGADWMMDTMMDWLRRMSYTPVRSGIALHISPRIHVAEMEKRLEIAVEETGQKATIVAWSLSALYAEGLGITRPDLIQRIVTLGSATKTNMRRAAHPFIRIPGSLVVGVNRTSEELLEILSKVPMPDSVDMYSIYGNMDGVFRQQDLGDPRSRENIEVEGSHLSYPWNPQVYEHLGRILSQPVVSAKILTFPTSSKPAA